MNLNKRIESLIPAEFLDLPIIKSGGLLPDDHYKVLWFYQTIEDEGGVFCTPFFITPGLYNGWRDAGLENTRKYIPGDLGWYHRVWGCVLYDEYGNAKVHYFDDTLPHLEVPSKNIYTLAYGEACEMYFLRLNSQDIGIPKKDYQIHDIVFGLDILDEGFWQNYKPDENVNNYVSTTARNIAEKYYRMATELIVKNYYID
jgi:hypothetical protein